MNPLVALAMRHAEREIDRLICETVEEYAQGLLERGARPEDLVQAMQPFLAWWRAHRADALAQCQAIAEQYADRVVVH